MKDDLKEATLIFRQEDREAVDLIIRAHMLKKYTEEESQDSTLTLSFDCEGDMGGIISSLVDQLVFRAIAFSFYWESSDPDVGGERHLRNAQAQTRVWEFSTLEKGLVDIESVREAAYMGDTAVWNLIDSIEDQYVPWEWDQSFAA